MLFAHAVQFATGIIDIFEVASRKNAVFEIFVVFHHVKIDRTVAFVGIAGLKDFLHQADLLNDMSRSVRFDGGRQAVESFHRMVEAVGVILRHFHRFELFKACFFGNLVFPLVGIVFQMPHVGDVAHIAHLVAEVLKVAEEEVESDGRTCVSEMRVTIDRRAANVHSHTAFVEGLENFFCT